jgi:hypothetical protein
MRPPVRIYWSGGRTNWINYGDCIGPALVTLLSSRAVRYAGIHACELICAGSILDKYARNAWRRTLALTFSPVRVWGSGTMHAAGASRLGRVDIASVRGKATLAKFNLPASTPLGDPGILAHLLLRRGRVAKKARWGIVPHRVDAGDDRIAALLSNAHGARPIDLANPDLRAVTEEIASCEFIASSSLHGIIAADALGVPNFRLVVSDGVRGGSWKFDDYVSSLGTRRLETRALDASLDLHAMEKVLAFDYAPRVEQLQAETLRAFERLNL